jgi:two-component system, chemotaxis family, chemotaxis protein CheY
MPRAQDPPPPNPLIVYSDPASGGHMRMVLQAMAVSQIFEATDLNSAFAIIREHRPDLLLCDLALSPGGGVDFSRNLRISENSPNPYIPIVMAVDRCDRQTIEAIRDAGVTEIVAKPFTLRSLTQKIAEITERPRPFVRCHGYFGPDRRRRIDAAYDGPMRRESDDRTSLAG